MDKREQTRQIARAESRRLADEQVKRAREYADAIFRENYRRDLVEKLGMKGDKQ